MIMAKRIIPLLLLLAMAVPSRAQLLSSNAFSAVGGTDVAVFGYFDFWKDSETAGHINLTVWNLSVYQQLDNTLTGFENGIIVGFGFDMGAGYTWDTSFDASPDPAHALPWLATGTDSINFTPEMPYFGDGVSMGIGADADNPAPGNGLAGGFWTTFTFGFTTTEDIGSTFNGDHFFGDADGQDLYFRFLSVSSNGSGTADSDKVYVAWDPGGGGFDNPVPEPSTYGLFASMALVALIVARRRKN